MSSGELALASRIRAELVADLRSCYFGLSQDLTAFCKFLDELTLDE